MWMYENPNHVIQFTQHNSKTIQAWNGVYFINCVSVQFYHLFWQCLHFYSFFPVSLWFFECKHNHHKYRFSLFSYICFFYSSEMNQMLAQNQKFHVSGIWLQQFFFPFWRWNKTNPNSRMFLVTKIVPFSHASVNIRYTTQMRINGAVFPTFYFEGTLPRWPCNTFKKPSHFHLDFNWKSQRSTMWAMLEITFVRI